MLIGVELPITEENVGRIDGYQLMKAHDMFLTNAIKGELGDYSKNQYVICRSEIIRRLKDYDSK